MFAVNQCVYGNSLFPGVWAGLVPHLVIIFTSSNPGPKARDVGRSAGHRREHADSSAYSLVIFYTLKIQRRIGTVMSIIPFPQGDWPQNL